MDSTCVIWAIIAWFVDVFIIGIFATYAVAWLYWNMGWKWGKKNDNPYEPLAKEAADIYNLRKKD